MNKWDAKGKKSFKEVIVNNKGKIIVTVSCIAVGTVSFLIFKQNVDIKNNTETIGFVRDIVKEGALEEAIATINRKINYRIDKIDHLKNSIEDNGPELIKKYEAELKELMVKLESFTKEYNSITIR